MPGENPTEDWMGLLALGMGLSCATILIWNYVRRKSRLKGIELPKELASPDYETLVGWLETINHEANPRFFGHREVMAMRLHPKDPSDTRCLPLVKGFVMTPTSPGGRGLTAIDKTELYTVVRNEEAQELLAEPDRFKLAFQGGEHSVFYVLL